MHVIDALKNSNCFEKIIAVTSPNSPQTHKILVEHDVEILETKTYKGECVLLVSKDDKNIYFD